MKKLAPHVAVLVVALAAYALASGERITGLAGIAGMKGCKLTQSTAVSIGNSSNVLMEWDTEDYDPNDYHDAPATQVTASAGRTFTYADANPDTITLSSGDLTADGFAVGMLLTVAGSGLNAGTYTIDTISATVITLASGDALSNEGPIGDTDTLDAIGTRMTVPTSGVYLVTGTVTLEQDATDSPHFLRLIHNGTAVEVVALRQSGNATYDSSAHGTFFIAATAGDYLELGVRHQLGASTDTVPGNTTFSVQLLAAD